MSYSWTQSLGYLELWIWQKNKKHRIAVLRGGSLVTFLQLNVSSFSEKNKTKLARQDLDHLKQCPQWIIFSFFFKKCRKNRPITGNSWRVATPYSTYARVCLSPPTHTHSFHCFLTFISKGKHSLGTGGKITLKVHISYRIILH